MASEDKTTEQLYKAVQDGNKEHVHDILQTHHDVVYDILNRTGPERGYYYLHEACKRGHEDVVTLLTSYYEQLDQPSPQVRGLWEGALSCPQPHGGESPMVHELSQPTPLFLPHFVTVSWREY